MKQITQLGATVEEAISLALQHLNTTRDKVEVEVLQEAKKGFLGIGARQAKISVSLKLGQVEENPSINVANKEDEVVLQEQNIEFNQEDKTEIVEEDKMKIDLDLQTETQQDPIQIAKDYLVSIANEMGVSQLTIETELKGKNVFFKIESEKAAFLIGKRGATLNSLQQLVQLVINKNAKSFLLVKLDVENYRERRQVALEQLAERMADRAVRTGKKVTLEPMPSYERKVIHNALANRIDIETHSEGIDPNRHLVIEPLK